MSGPPPPSLHRFLYYETKSALKISTLNVVCVLINETKEFLKKINTRSHARAHASVYTRVEYSWLYIDHGRLIGVIIIIQTVLKVLIT